MSNPKITPYQPSEIVPVKKDSLKSATMADVTSLLDSLEVNIEVRLGQALMSLGELQNLTKGDVITLEQTLEQSVDIIFNQQVIAKGRLMTVDDNFGVEILELAK